MEQSRLDIKNKLKQQEIPTKIYPYYLVYKYNFSKTFVIGYESEELAEAVRSQMSKPEVIRNYISDEYPYEVFQAWENEKN